uniref:Uncharacterized protein n=1 Tax=Oryza brachyantha TaxID=4533 RepID=J3LZX3_ORYBR
MAWPYPLTASHPRHPHRDVATESPPPSSACLQDLLRFKMTKLTPVFFIVHFLTNLQNILHLLRKIYELNVAGLERIMESFAKERLAFMKNSSNQNNRCVVLIIVIKQIITVCISMIYIVGLQWYRIALICKKVSGLLNLEEPSVKDQLKGGSFINYYMV